MYSSDMLEIAMNESFGFEPVNEGFLSKLMNMFKNKDKKRDSKPVTRYYISLKLKEPGTVSKNDIFYYGSKKKAILAYLRGFYQINVEKCTISSSNNKKLEKDLDKMVFLNTLEASATTKIVEVEEAPLSDLMKKYGIKLTVSEETDKMEKERTKIYRDCITIVKGYINQLKSEYPNITKGFEVTNYFSDDEYDDLSDFVSGFNDYICLIDCDAWAYTNNKARTEEEYENYSKCFDTLYDQLKKNNILAKYGTIDYYGDWDDGPIVLIVGEG